MRVAIIGGGIIGVTAAHALLDAGHGVTIVDPGGFGDGASRGNAGWIAHMDVLPLASPKAWRNLPRWLMDPLGPLSVRPGYVPRLAPWLVRFLAASRPRRIRASTLAITALNQKALPAWQRRLQSLGMEGFLRPRGILSVWADPRAFEAARPLLAYQAEIGIPVEILDRARLHGLEPALGAAAVAGALFPTGCHVSDPHLLTEALGQAALDRGAALMRRPARALHAREGIVIETDDGSNLTADRAVIAAGAWSRPFARAFGDRVPLDTERGYNTTLPSGTLGLSRPVMFEGEGFVTTPLDTGDRIGGAVEFAGLDGAPNFARIDAILARLKRFLPEARLERQTSWMGLRPSIPDSLPVIGTARGDARILYAFGHGHHGLTQAAITAELVAALIDDREPALALAPYSPRRF
ncbi:MAG: FAD-dependent oxidoreductase [Microvirga sp.]